MISFFCCYYSMSSRAAAGVTPPPLSVRAQWPNQTESSQAYLCAFTPRLVSARPACEEHPQAETRVNPAQGGSGDGTANRRTCVAMRGLEEPERWRRISTPPQSVILDLLAAAQHGHTQHTRSTPFRGSAPP
jgi:hypothetical protein